MIALSGQSLASWQADTGIYSYDALPSVSNKQYAPSRLHNSGYDAPQNFPNAPGSKVRKRSFSAFVDGSFVPKRTGLETRGYKPAPGERTIQGQVDAATQAGNPTVQRGGQDLFRLRSGGHGQAGATATPQNVYRTNPRTGERFGPQSGPDRAVTDRDIGELYKAQTNHGTSSIRTRSGR